MRAWQKRGAKDFLLCTCRTRMARGLQKEQSQKKNAAKQDAAQKKGTQKGEGASKMKGSCICPICKATVPSYKLLCEHYDSKHPKDKCPEEGSL